MSAHINVNNIDSHIVGHFHRTKDMFSWSKVS